MKWVPLLLIGCGLFSFIAAVKDWEFFMGSRKAEFLVFIMGRNGARVFYALLGVFIIVGALLVMANPEQAWGK